MVEKLLDVVSHWESQVGQALFLLLLLGCAMECVVQLAKYAVALVRGWPPVENEPEETEDETNQTE